MSLTRRAGETRKRRVQELAFLIALVACAALILTPILRRQARERAEQEARAEALFNQAMEFAGKVKRMAPPAAGLAYRAACGAQPDELIERMLPFELEGVNGRLAEDPNNVELLFERVDILRQMNRPQELLADLSQILSHDPGNSRALEQRANLLAAQGQYAAAARDLQAITDDEWGDPWLQAYVYVGIGKNQEALDTYNALIDNGCGDSPEEYWGRAMAKRAMGDEDSALEDLRLARELDPSFCLHWPNAPHGDPGVHEQPCSKPAWRW